MPYLPPYNTILLTQEYTTPNLPLLESFFFFSPYSLTTSLFRVVSVDPRPRLLGPPGINGGTF